MEIKITIDSFNPTSVKRVPEANPKLKHIKLNLTTTITQENKKDIIKKFRGDSFFIFKKSIFLEKYTTQMQEYLVEEIKPLLDKKTFNKYLKDLTKELKKRCKKESIPLNETKWEEIKELRPVLSYDYKKDNLISLTQRNVSDKYKDKFLSKMIKQIKKDKKIDITVNPMGVTLSFLLHNLKKSIKIIKEYGNEKELADTFNSYSYIGLNREEIDLLNEYDLQPAKLFLDQMEKNEGFKIKNYSVFNYLTEAKDFNQLEEKLKNSNEGFKINLGALIVMLPSFVSLENKKEWEKLIPYCIIKNVELSEIMAKEIKKCDLEVYGTLSNENKDTLAYDISLKLFEIEEFHTELERHKEDIKNVELLEKYNKMEKSNKVIIKYGEEDKVLYEIEANELKEYDYESNLINEYKILKEKEGIYTLESKRDSNVEIVLNIRHNNQFQFRPKELKEMRVTFNTQIKSFTYEIDKNEVIKCIDRTHKEELNAFDYEYEELDHFTLTRYKRNTLEEDFEVFNINKTMILQGKIVELNKDNKVISEIKSNTPEETILDFLKMKEIN